MTTLVALAVLCGPLWDDPPKDRLGKLLKEARIETHRDVPYVANGHPRQKLDLFVPPADVPPPAGLKRRPVAVWIHGGGWEGGDKYPNPAAPLLRNGFAVAGINYRFSQHAPLPAQCDDCHAALRHLRSLAAKHNLDVDRVAVWGASAGGHLAAWVGTAGRDQATRVLAVVDYFGPTDLGLYAPRARKGDTFYRLFGAVPKADAPLAKQADPVTHADRGDAAFLIFHGTTDRLVPLDHSKRLEAALKKAGVPVTLRVVEGAGHSFHGRPEVLAETYEFLEKQLTKPLSVAVSPKVPGARRDDVKP